MTALLPPVPLGALERDLARAQRALRSHESVWCAGPGPDCNTCRTFTQAEQRAQRRLDAALSQTPERQIPEGLAERALQDAQLAAAEARGDWT